VKLECSLGFALSWRDCVLAAPCERVDQLGGVLELCHRLVTLPPCRGPHEGMSGVRRGDIHLWADPSFLRPFPWRGRSAGGGLFVAEVAAGLNVMGIWRIMARPRVGRVNDAPQLVGQREEGRDVLPVAPEAWAVIG
jgi:hypothetical protein